MPVRSVPGPSLNPTPSRLMSPSRRIKWPKPKPTPTQAGSIRVDSCPGTTRHQQTGHRWWRQSLPEEETQKVKLVFAWVCMLSQSIDAAYRNDCKNQFHHAVLNGYALGSANIISQQQRTHQNVIERQQNRTESQRRLCR